MNAPDGSQTDLLCPNCGGQRLYSPKQRGLVCESCGDLHRLETENDRDARAEFPYDPETPREEPVAPDGALAYRCRTCGGEVIFTGAALSERCPYCDGPVVLGGTDAAFATMALVPFEVAEETAQEAARVWVARRYAAPIGLADVVAEARVAGLYAPFWTFDCREAVQYWARYVTGSGKHKRTHSTKGSMDIRFDDLLMPASDHVTPLIRDGILHDFRPDRLRPYRAGYLAGFAAERHHQSVAQGLAANRGDKRLLIRNRIKRRIGRSRVTEIRYNTDTTGIHYRRILLPVWILHYRHAGNAYKVVVSGINGQTFGERPFSRLKLLGYAAACAAATVILGAMWGAGAAP